VANLNQCYRGGNAQGKPGYWIGFDYDTEFVEKLKKTIPHTHREWHKSKKIWWVSEEYDQELQTLFSNFYALAHQQRSMF